MSEPNEILNDLRRLKERVSKGPFSPEAKRQMLERLSDTEEELKDDVW